MKTIISLLLLTILVAGCSTGYHRSGFTGGYSDMKLQDDIFKVSFRGNGYTGKGKTSDLALLTYIPLVEGSEFLDLTLLITTG